MPSKPLTREDCVLGALLERWARERPDKNFLEFADDTAWTFAETLALTRRAAAGLKKLGVKRGSHVLCWSPNRREAVLTWFGANWLGAVFVPMNTAYKGGLLQHTIALSDAEVMLAHADLLPRLADVSLGKLRHLIVIGGEAAALPGVSLHDVSVLETKDSAEPETPVQPWDVTSIMFTSGTTGPSKAVVRTYIQEHNSVYEPLYYMGPDDRMLANMPLFHVTGTGGIFDRLFKGGTAVLYDGFKADAFWDVIRRFRITGCCLVGAMTQFLLKQPPDPRDRDHTLRNVTTVPWNADSLAVAERYGIKMNTAFNMTEISTPIMAEPNPPRFGTCGKLRAGVEARIVDERDLEVPLGTVGELVIRTENPWEISPRYHANPEATVAAWRNGWFHTGDAFRKDEEGYFYFVDRKKDAIRRRGENISSFEVESEAGRHPAVREAAAIPVPSEFGEDEVMLIVAAQPGHRIDPLELLKFLEPRMAHFMLPRFIRIVEALPRTPTAKVEKHRLRGEGVTPETWDREAHGVTVRHGQLRVAS